MIYSVNRVQLIGYVGSDPEIKTTLLEKTVTKFTVATVNGYYNRTKEQWINHTTWHKIEAWQLSESLRKTIKKGSRVFVEGRYEPFEYVSKDKRKEQYWRVVASVVIVLDRINKNNLIDERLIDDDAVPDVNVGFDNIPF